MTFKTEQEAFWAGETSGKEEIKMSNVRSDSKLFALRGLM
jgi:hypothetical protein